MILNDLSNAIKKMGEKTSFHKHFKFKNILPIGISGDIFINTLNSNFQSCTAVIQHRTGKHKYSNYSGTIFIGTGVHGKAFMILLWSRLFQIP